MPELLELPPNLTLGQFQDLVNDRIRDLNMLLKGFVENPATEDVDTGTNRIINLADPKNELDGVNLRTLKRFLPFATEETAAAGTSVQVIDKGILIWYDIPTDGSGAGDLYPGDQTPEYVIRDGEGGTLSSWGVHLEGAPTGRDAILDVYLNGVTVFASTKVVIPAGSVTASGSGFAGTVTVVPGDRIRGVVYQVGSILAGKTAGLHLYIT